MRSLRKWLCVTLASLALLSPLAFTSTADAHGGGRRCAPPRVVHRPVVHYRGPIYSQCFSVYYRSCPQVAWQMAGSYSQLSGACAQRDSLQSQGFQAFIR